MSRVGVKSVCRILTVLQLVSKREFFQARSRLASVAQKVTKMGLLEGYALFGDTSVSMFTGLIAYLRRLQGLSIEMKTTCPKLVSIRHLSIERVTAWVPTCRVFASWREEPRLLARLEGGVLVSVP